MLLLLSRITLGVVLALVLQYVDWNQRTLHISEPFSDDGDIVTNSGDGSGGDDNVLLCIAPV